MKNFISFSLSLLSFSATAQLSISLPDGKIYLDKREELRASARKICGSSYPKFDKIPGLAFFNPAPRTIDGIDFPRNYSIHYRGIDFKNKQMDVERFIKAAFGDGSSFTMSKDHFSMIQNKQLLLNRIEEIRQPDVYECGSLLVSEWENFSFNQKAVIISDFLSLLESTASRDSRQFKVDYRYGNYNEWPSDVVFTTVYPQIANPYGGNILLYRDLSGRGADLNYYNKVVNRQWGRIYDYAGVDNGEFVFSHFMLPEEMIGFQIMDKDWNGDLYTTVDEVRFKRINVGFYKLYTQSGVPYVVMVDGENKETCVRQKNNFQLEICDTRNYQDKATSPFPLSVAKKVKALAFIYPCSSKTPADCKLPPKVLEGFESSKRLDELKRLDSLKNIIADLGLAIYAPVPLVNVPKDEASIQRVIRIKEATWGQNLGATPGNATKLAGDWCNGRKTCDYKISKKFLTDPLIPRGSKNFEISYACTESGRDVISAKDKILVHKYDSDTEGKIIKLSCED